MDNFVATDEYADLPAEYQGLSGAARVMDEVLKKCVWSQGMSAQKLLPYLWEESAELGDAVLSGDSTAVSEELGDLLWQVLFQSALAERAGEGFSISDVANGLSAKMIRRHPHVFAGAPATTHAEVFEWWSAARALEKRERKSVLDGVSEQMPSLLLAQKLLRKAQGLGVAAVPAVAASTDGSAVEAGVDAAAELQGELFALLRRANDLGVDAETLLRGGVLDLKAEILAAEAAGA